MRLNQANNLKDNPIGRPSVWEKIDTNEIGQGRFFTEGTYGNKKNLGLKGQLSKIRRLGRFGATQNLSKKNIESIYDIVSDRLKKHSTSGKAHINRLDKKAIMAEAEKLVRTDSKFTRYDKADVKSIIDAMAEKMRDKSLGKERYNVNETQQNQESTGNKTINAPTYIEINTPTMNDLDFINTKNEKEDLETPDEQNYETRTKNIENRSEKSIQIPDIKDLPDMPI
ncbi:MAG: hypothetical protein PHZ07_04735 [Patescibacteria group bacterium]|nr:hypothetical protein [Patescibacteria group bacterium]MDD4304120.1 hypothetical protein [Patescibacteria group bacterium]MDD4694997.1 hypothetical protein [Patescibacteria group bacterium]